MIDERELQSLGQRRGPLATPSAEIVRRGRRLRRRTSALRAGAVAAGVFAVVMVAVSLAGGGSGYQVRFADGGNPALVRDSDGGFPHLLVGGWEVLRADDQEWSGRGGSDWFHSAETTFVRDGVHHDPRDPMAAPDGPMVTLHMTEGDTDALEDLVRDRADGGKQTRRDVFGYPATITDYDGNNTMSAIWFADRVVYELRLDLGRGEDFFAALEALQVVDRAVWEAAVPDTTVTPDERPAEVDSILSDIPQPTGFDAEPLRRAKASIDRYQLGARVISAVGCAWADRWSEARRTGDRAAEQQAVDALGTSRTWQILKDMDFEGDYPEGVWQAAEDMASGTPPNRFMSVEDGVRNKLGC